MEETLEGGRGSPRAVEPLEREKWKDRIVTGLQDILRFRVYNLSRFNCGLVASICTGSVESLDSINSRTMNGLW